MPAISSMRLVSSQPVRWIKLAAVALALLNVAAAQQPSASDPLIALRGASLTVWQSGRPQFLNWGAIHSSLITDTPTLRLQYRLLQPQELLPALSAARTSGTLPDVVFVDNWGQGGPLIEQQSVVERVGRSLIVPSRGWWFLMKEGQHRVAAEAFLRWLENPPAWHPPHLSSTGMTEADRSQIAAATASATVSLPGGTDDSPAMDPKAAQFQTSDWGTYCGHITAMDHPTLRFLFGNNALAYTLFTSDASTEGGKVDCSGILHSFAILRKQGGSWKVMMLMPSVSLDQAVDVADHFDRLGLIAESISPPPAPSLLSPADGEKQTRFPKQQIAWQQSDPPASIVAYAVESRAGVIQKDGSVSYGPTILTFVDPGQYGAIIRMPTPFGVGMQPHQWRVWAIGRDGQIALSEWHTINFTN